MNVLASIDSPLGPLIAAATDDALSVLGFLVSPVESEQSSLTPSLVKLLGAERLRKVPNVSQTRHPILMQTQAELAEYFAKQRQRFDVPLQPMGTDFQQHVWQALTRIPYGQTLSYKEQAIAIGKPTACRAVAAANGRNPISIMIPCHRVIGSNGHLTGFASGLERKSLLLALETKHAQLPLSIQ
jgi:O-6-methylguanine DNA methyltransferase